VPGARASRFVMIALAVIVIAGLLAMAMATPGTVTPR
jgi:hypothetical protein